MFRNEINVTARAPTLTTMPPMSKQERMRRIIEQETEGWSPRQRAALMHRLGREATRLDARTRHPSAGRLACAVDEKTVQTPALEAIDEAIEWALSTRDARLTLSMPPQEGKSSRVAVWGTIRALVQDPTRRVVIASYSDALARTASRTARNLVRDHGTGATDPLTGAPLPDRLGLSLADDKSAAGNWKVAGHSGGCYAVGVGGSLTGQPAEVLIIDDAHKGMAEADSQSEREKVLTWWDSVAQTRLAAGAPVIIIQTRWHEDDLVGHVTKQDPGRWRVVNIPAVSEKGIPDALGREPGVAMDSARGRTAEDFAQTRAAVGERVWSALYQGQPTPSGGGLFSAVDFNRHRVPEIPAPVAARLVSVDPAETGKRDEAGVLGLSVTADSRVWITDDVSGRMQSDEWARAAVLLALRNQATEIVVEAYTTGQTYQRVVQAAWRRVRDEARLLRKANGSIEAATVAYAMSEDRPADPMQALLDVQALAVPDQTDPPFLIKLWRGKGDKVARASGTRQAASTGRLRMVGAHPELEAQACFPAGTRIAVASGEKNIEDVKPGDQVRTRKGLRTVLARWDNGVRPTVQVNFDGGEVRCTPDHLVWSPGKDGWIEASSVMEYGTISTWHGLTLDPRSGSTGTSIASGTTATTSGTRAPSTSERDDASSCTEMYGNTTTDLSRKAWKSIMSTTTGETTTSATFGASVPQSTHQSTRTKGGLDGLARTEASAQTKCGEAGNPEKSSAPTAEPLSCQPECAPSTALCLAINATTGLEAGNKNVSATTQRSGVRSTNVHSVERTGRSERVYDLSVEGVHEFFANGVLVHNCTWLPGQDSPDRMDAMTQGYERAVQMVGGQAQIAAPTTTAAPTGTAGPGGFWSSTVG